MAPFKTVEKPWGYEIWFELNDKYCFKKLFIKSGHKLSLQYHQYKKETLLLISGDAILTIDREEIHFGQNDFITIDPGTLHRIEAVTDCVVLEASTPEVTDVVRVSDDYERA